MTSPLPARKPLPRDHFRQPLRPTPFHPRIAALSTTQSWYGWAGCLAPGIVRDEAAEYFAIRNSASVFDISPMIKYRIEGPEAEAFLDKLTLRDVGKLGVGRVQYTAWCDDEGQVIDDGTIFRLARDRFHLFCQERHFAWLCDCAHGFDVAIADVTDAMAGLSLQGPTACAVLRRAGLAGIETLKPFGLRDFEAGELSLAVSRTGFTGDLGYEILVAPGDALRLWDLLFEAGRLHGITAIGNVALDTARLEAGFILTNSDFVGAAAAIRADRRRSPFEIGLGWMVAFDKAAHFNGRSALLRQKTQDSFRHVLVGLEIEGNVAADHALIYLNGKREVGHVTAAAWSPTTKRNLAIGSLTRPYGDRVKDDLFAEIYALRELSWQRLMVRAKVVERPFFVHPRRTATPPADF